MIQISFKPSFIKQLHKLEKSLVDEVFEKIDILKSPSNNASLKIHKLHGQMKNCWSLSVNYKIRIVFQYESKEEIILLAIGDHSIYN